MDKLEKRIVSTAEELLYKNDAVCMIDVLMKMRWLEAIHLENWKRQVSEFYSTLEASMQSTPEKRLKALQILERWAAAKGLDSIFSEYYPVARNADSQLQITLSGDQDLEKRFRRKFLRKGVSQKKKDSVAKKATKRPDLLVFVNFKGQFCSECGAVIDVGYYSFIENNKPLCLTCADMDHLILLPSGDVAMTRRAKKYSPIWAILLRFNRRRKRQERQGILVTREAIEKAEEECLNDADKRALQRKRSEERRKLQDSQLVRDMTAKILEQFPGCPKEEAKEIAAHACERKSGRVGRSEDGRNLGATAVRLAVIAHIRHIHTKYDSMLMIGVDREHARQKIASTIQDVLDKWS